MGKDDAVHNELHITPNLLSSMRSKFIQKFVPFALFLPCAACANPLLSSWYTEKSGSYARIYDSLEDMAAGNASTTWTTSGQGTQALPAYAGVQEVSHSAEWVYIKSTGLGTHVMGPWFFDEAKTQENKHMRQFFQ